MRSSAVCRLWEKMEQKASKKYIQSIDFNSFHGINNTLEIPQNGVIAFCGLNGVGKSTIISVIKKMVGIELSESEKYKIDDSVITAKYLSESVIDVDTNTNTIENMSNEADFFRFINFDLVNNLHNKLISETNLSERLDQFESTVFTPVEICEVNAIVGRNYKQISCIELDDTDDCVPYFKVAEPGFEYGSEKMGKGEYFILFLFWNLRKMSKYNTVVLDEPETGISISSQKNLMNYLCNCVNEKKNNLIITTHSPFILERLPLNNIRILVRNGSNASIIQPKYMLDVNRHLNLEPRYEGVFLVEDQTALDYILCILEMFAPDLLSTYYVGIANGGDSIIKQVLLSAEKIKNNPFDFWGIFDGDVRNDSQFNSLEHGFFLPGETPFEEEFRDFIQIDNNRKNISRSLNIDDDRLCMSINSHIGEDYHDFFINVFKEMGLKGKDFISAYCKLQPKEIYQTFVKDLKIKMGILPST